jgi:hypothetical protein
MERRDEPPPAFLVPLSILLIEYPPRVRATCCLSPGFRLDAGTGAGRIFFEISVEVKLQKDFVDQPMQPATLELVKDGVP